MGYESLQAAVRDLERREMLVRIKTELDPDLEIAQVHRRVQQAGGPALLFERVKGSPFPALSNLYGTFERTEFVFRRTLEKVRDVVALKSDPTQALRHPLRYAKAPFTALTALPQRIAPWRSPVFQYSTTPDKLPRIKSWPMDGGPFVTLPQVFSLDPETPSLMKSNLGMYRVQMAGNQFAPDEMGLHYQIHRGIGVHHARHKELGKPFKVSIFVGGPPAHAFAAIMPLPEGLSELTFAGMLAGRRFRYAEHQGHVLSADADFCIVGTILPDTLKPEGPFGDHLGYYSLAHDFPVLRVENVFYKRDAIWHFTVVGRPPAEDSSFGHLIHLLVDRLVPDEFPGLKDIHAVDAAGVHPLLLAIGSERYMPFRKREPEEILTIANHLLGKGQTTLAKYLFIAAKEDDKNLSTKNIYAFFAHVLERMDPRRDLHFQTKTTIDTLDYTGTGWNRGSKVVVAAAGDPIRQLSGELPASLRLPEGFERPKVPHKGILVVQAPAYGRPQDEERRVEEFCESLHGQPLEGFPLVVLADDSAFAAKTVDNFVWVTFTRSNPSHDIFGTRASVRHKHWGCEGPLVIDARVKPHHAPPLIEDPEIARRVDRLFAKGGELHRLG